MNPERFHRIRAVLERRQPDLTVLMEGVHKPHNLSAILRNCDATGVLRTHAIPPEKGLDIHHHTSGGTGKWVKVEVHADVASAVGHLHEDGFTVLAAHMTRKASDFREVDLTRKVAFMVGTELHGISEEGLALADEMVMIPMAGMAHSLNVSVATSLLLFEAYRQRQAKGMYENSRIPEKDRELLLFEWLYPEIAQVLRNRGDSYPPISEDGEILWETESPQETESSPGTGSP